MQDLHLADVIFVATHSQGSIVSTHLLDRLIRDNHIRTAGNMAAWSDGVASVGEAVPGLASIGVGSADVSVGLGLAVPTTTRLKPHRICCLVLCGIHLGPLRYLKSSSLVKPYIQVGHSFGRHLGLIC